MTDAEVTEKEEAGIFSVKEQVEVPTVAVPFFVVTFIVPVPEELSAGTYAASPFTFPLAWLNVGVVENVPEMAV